MLIEHRTYQLKTSATGAYFDIFGRAGLDLQERHMAPCLGHYMTEIGPHSQIIALWQHESFEARMAGRSRLREDAQWRDLVANISPLVESIDSKLLVPSPIWRDRS